MARPSEALALVFDTGNTLSSDRFELARSVVFATARTRLIYGQSGAGGDELGLIVAGGDQTDSRLAEENPGGYLNISVRVPVARLAIDVLREIQVLKHGELGVNLIDVLEVAGEHLTDRYARSSLKRRVLLVTSGHGGMGDNWEQSVEEMKALAKDFVEQNVQLHVVLVDGLSIDDIDSFDNEEPILNDSCIGQEDVQTENSKTVKEQCSDEDEQDLQDGAESNAPVFTKQHEALFSESALRRSTSRRNELYHRVATKRRDLCSKRVQERQSIESEREGEDTAGDVDEFVPPKRRLVKQEALLQAVATASGGALVSLAEVAESVDEPQVVHKRPTAKFRGVLDIAEVLRIPVRVYNRVAMTTRETGKKIAWKSSLRMRRNVPVETSMQYVAEGELRAGIEIDAERIAAAYPYGPNLVHEDTSPSSAFPWSISCPKSFSVICSVRQDQIAPHQFLGNVSVVLPISGLPNCEPQRAMRAVVEGLSATRMGLLARMVPRDHGKPKLVYLWPKIEYKATPCGESTEQSQGDAELDEQLSQTGAPWAWYLYMVDLPVRDDIREYRFARLDHVAATLSSENQKAMDDLVDAFDLGNATPRSPTAADASGVNSQPDENVHDASDELEVSAGADEFVPFDPRRFCSPALDLFYRAVVQRYLSEPEDTSLPDLPPWAERLLDPTAQIHPKNRGRAAHALSAVQHAFPLTQCDKTQRRPRRPVRTANGQEASISRFLPPEPADVDDQSADERQDHEHSQDEGIEPEAYGIRGEDFGQVGHAPVPESPEPTNHEPNEQASGDIASGVTDCPLLVSVESPVRDMRALIRQGSHDIAFDTMATVIYGKIHEREFPHATECLLALRTACKELGRINEYHAVVEQIIQRTDGNRATEHSHVAFVRYTALAPNGSDAFSMLQPIDEKHEAAMGPTKSEVEQIFRSVERIRSAAEAEKESSFSAVTEKKG